MKEQIWQTNAEDLNKKTIETKEKIIAGGDEAVKGTEELIKLMDDVDKGDIKEQARTENKFRETPEGIKSRIEELREKISKGGPEALEATHKIQILNKQYEQLWEEAKKGKNNYNHPSEVKKDGAQFQGYYATSTDINSLKKELQWEYVINEGILNGKSNENLLNGTVDEDSYGNKYISFYTCGLKVCLKVAYLPKNFDLGH